VSTVLFNLSKHNVKTFTNADTFNSHYHEIWDHFSTYHSTFTDGSKTTNKTAAATFFQNSDVSLSHRLPKLFSIYSAELYANKLALLHIPKMHYHCHILFSDSMSSLQAIASKWIEHPIMLDIFVHYNYLLSKNHNCWISSHTGILALIKKQNWLLILQLNHYQFQLQILNPTLISISV